MKTTTLLFFASMLGMSMQLHAQIPNAGFENWTTGNPDSWITNNVPTLVVPVVQEMPSYSGTYALKGEVVSFSGSPYPPLLASTDLSANGFPVTQAYSTFSFYYKLNLTGTAVFDVTVAFYDAGGGWVGGGSQLFSGVVSSYALANVPLSFIGPNPVECIIIFGIADTVAPDPPVGNYFIVDALAFSGISAIQGISSETLQVTAFPNPASDFVTLRTSIPSSGNTDIYVYDIYGNVVKKLSAATKAGIVLEQEMSLAGLPAGIYPVKMVNGKKQWMTKIVRQ